MAKQSKMTAVIATGPPVPKTTLSKLHSTMQDMSRMSDAVNGYGPQPPLDQVPLPPEVQQAAKTLHSHLNQTMTNAKKNLFKPGPAKAPTKGSKKPTKAPANAPGTPFNFKKGK